MYNDFISSKINILLILKDFFIYFDTEGKTPPHRKYATVHVKVRVLCTYRVVNKTLRQQNRNARSNIVRYETISRVRLSLRTSYHRPSSHGNACTAAAATTAARLC